MNDEITLRDTFAAAALTGMLRKLRPGSVFDLTITARQAFEVADAMIRQRARSLQSETAASGEKPLRNGAPAGRETVQPTITDAEREALETARSLFRQGWRHFANESDRDRAAALDALLARLGGGK